MIVISITFLALFIESIVDGEILNLSWRTLYFLGIYILLATVFIGTLSYFFDKTYFPWRERRLIRSSKLYFLADLGFIFKPEEDLYEGTWQTYEVLIEPESTFDSDVFLTITAFIDPSDVEENVLVELQEWYTLDSMNGFAWFTQRMRGLRKIPKPEKFEQELNQFIGTLKENGIPPDKFKD
ncbi:MAG: hypothetical protein AAFP70_10670 [Calditrichota bacterium]